MESTTSLTVEQDYDTQIAVPTLWLMQLKRKLGWVQELLMQSFSSTSQVVAFDHVVTSCVKAPCNKGINGSADHNTNGISNHINTATSFGNTANKRTYAKTKLIHQTQRYFFATVCLRKVWLGWVKYSSTQTPQHRSKPRNFIIAFNLNETAFRHKKAHCIAMGWS